MHAEIYGYIEGHKSVREQEYSTHQTCKAGL